ncbi:MAG: hypothetical protein LKJ83_01745 [Eubacteriaceae bacterium]|nr:hypothetical protein [Eubacteriaceae bacterium]
MANVDRSPSSRNGLTKSQIIGLVISAILLGCCLVIKPDFKVNTHDLIIYKLELIIAYLIGFVVPLLITLDIRGIRKHVPLFAKKMKRFTILAWLILIIVAGMASNGVGILHSNSYKAANAKYEKQQSNENTTTDKAKKTTKKKVIKKSDTKEKADVDKKNPYNYVSSIETAFFATDTQSKNGKLYTNVKKDVGELSTTFTVKYDIDAMVDDNVDGTAGVDDFKAVINDHSLMSATVNNYETKGGFLTVICKIKGKTGSAKMYIKCKNGVRSDAVVINIK